jgi:hypothetical protein
MRQIKFKPPIRGLTDIKTNTFRAGLAWFKRLKVGDELQLLNTKTLEVFATATVAELHSGTKEEMAEIHGAFNHSIQALEITDNIAATILKRLKNSSGTRAFESTNYITVIYLKEIKWQEDGKNLKDT